MKLNRAELEMAIRIWANEANEKCNEFVKLRHELGLKIYDHNIAIIKSFTTQNIREIPEGIVEKIKKGDYGDVLGGVDIDGMRALPSYNALNPLAALRIHYRKISKLKRQFQDAMPVIRELISRLKELDKQATTEGIRNVINSHRITIMDCLDEQLPGSDHDFWPYVQGLFPIGTTIKRDDLLQVVTPTKSKKHWDGEPVTNFSKQLKDIPEELDLKSFERLIFVEKIEDFYDSYLSDIFTEHTFKLMKEHEEITGEKLIDPFKLIEDISGKSLPTYTATKDEFGDIVSMERNGPKLKVVGNK